ncbi:hypothetical protein HDU85_007789 [Gaertneriomyces sp. JEL0708]|nr:hypothetical protein HDU85_007789 [Gaertneriomyces sp. JEL0708]
MFQTPSTQPTPAASANMFASQNQNQAPLTDQLTYIANAWNPNSPQCQFKHYFYNMVHPTEARLYGPPDASNLPLWEQAQRDNPDPSCMVPVLAVGFDDVKKRLEVQNRTYEAHKAELERMREQLQQLHTKHYLNTLTKVEEYRRRLTVLASKTVQLMKNVQVIRNQGYSIRPEEEKFKSRIEAMKRELHRPSVFRGRLNEVWAQLQQLKDARQFSVTGGIEHAYTIAPEDEKLIFQTLAGHQTGLAVLTDVVQKDSKDAGEILRTYTETGQLS